MNARLSIVARPLTPDAYGPYGDVIMASARGEPGKPANQGTARRFDWLAEVVNLRSAQAENPARLDVAVFRCAPLSLDDAAIRVALLEKHPASTQLFVPMNARRYLVIVALGGDAPDLGTLAAFVAAGGQGVSYRPGVWHHPMIALDAETDFTCLVWEDGSEGDCAVVEYPEEIRAEVVFRRA